MEQFGVTAEYTTTPKRPHRKSLHQRTNSAHTVMELSAIQEEIRLIDDRIRCFSNELNYGVVDNSSLTSGGSGQISTNNSFYSSNNTHSGAGYNECAIPSPSMVKNSRVVASVRDGELCRVAAEGNVRGILLILSEEQHDIDCIDMDGRTPLHLAAVNGHKAAAELLMSRGADTAVEDDEGKTAHDLALDMGHEDVSALFFLSLQQSEPESFSQQMLSQTPNTPKTFSQKQSSAFNTMSPLGVALARDFKIGTGLVLIMVGLPGRGKTYICQRIRRYFMWFGFDCEILSHAKFRRSLQPEKRRTSAAKGMEGTPPEPSPGTGGSSGEKNAARDADSNLEVTVAQCIAAEIQAQFATRVGSVAIVDGTNSTAKRRNCLAQEIVKTGCVEMGRDLIFVEVQNDDPQLIRGNVLRAKELLGADAPSDFEEQYYRNMADHEKVYVPLEHEREGRTHSFIKILNERSLFLNKIGGIVPSRLAYLLHNLKHSPVPLYLTLPGEHEDILLDKLGGNGRLTQRGKAYSVAVYNFMAGEKLPNLAVLTGSKKRCLHTCFYFQKTALGLEGSCNEDKDAKFSCTVESFPTLDDISYGDCEGQTIDEVSQTLPNTLNNLMSEPYTTAWPNGESVQQVYMSRLEPHIHDIQASQHPVLVVSHTCIIQGLLTYFDDSSKYKNPEEFIDVQVPRNTVMRLSHFAGGRRVELFDLSTEVDSIMEQWEQAGPKEGGSAPATPSKAAA